MSKQIKNIFSDSACPSEEAMFMYMDNLLKGEERHAFERHLAGCSLCADAFDGLSMMSRSEVRESVAALHNQIESQYAAVGNRVNWPWAVAASVSMLLIAGTWAYLHNNGLSDVAVQTEIAQPLKEPELNPSANTNKITPDTTTVLPADKTIALTEEKPREENISSDAGKVFSMEPKEDYLPKPSPQNIKLTPQTQAPQAVSDVEVMAPATAGAAFNEKPVRKKSDLSQNAASIKPENISMGSTHISSEMLAFEESIINGNFDEMKVNTAPSTMKTKAVAKPSAVAPSPSMKEEEAPVPSMEKEKSVVLKEEPVIKQNAPAPKPKPVKAPTKPYLQEEERKKTKSMPECKDCPDKQISQEAVQDMQVLTYDYAVKKFNEKSYADAHLKFDQYIKENPQSEDAGRAGIYDAICLVYLNKPEEAIKRLNELSSQKNFSDDAKWLKAAIFIDQDKNNEAVSLLQELVKTRTYKEKASKAIEDLR